MVASDRMLVTFHLEDLITGERIPYDLPVPKNVGREWVIEQLTADLIAIGNQGGIAEFQDLAFPVRVHSACLFIDDEMSDELCIGQN